MGLVVGGFVDPGVGGELGPLVVRATIGCSVVGFNVVGCSVVGFNVGSDVGLDVGFKLGFEVGVDVGFAVGTIVEGFDVTSGLAVGVPCTISEVVGSSVSPVVGLVDGVLVG